MNTNCKTGCKNSLASLQAYALNPLKSLERAMGIEPTTSSFGKLAFYR